MLPPPEGDREIVPYLGRYLRLYGLHLVEQSVSYEIVLRIRVATTRFVTSAIPDDIERIWRGDPQRAVEFVREAIEPQFATLHDTEDAWTHLRLPGWESQWEQYLAQRNLMQPGELINALPHRDQLARYHPLKISLSTSNRLLRSIDNVSRILNMAHSALTVADMARRLWQDWQIGQEKLRLMQVRRLLLEDAIQATRASQDHALQQALDPTFVERFLTAGGDDSTYDILFGDLDDSQ